MENLNLNNPNNNPKENLDYNDIQKMVFISNALNDGWTIKKLSNNKYELTKNKENFIKKEIDLENFIKEKLNIENINK